MKVRVIGSEKEGNIIQGKERIGQEVVIRHGGKVKIGTVVRTKRYTRTQMRFSRVTVMLKNSTSRVKGPISKGLPETVRTLCTSQL